MMSRRRRWPCLRDREERRERGGDPKQGQSGDNNTQGKAEPISNETARSSTSVAVRYKRSSQTDQVSVQSGWRPAAAPRARGTRVILADLSLISHPATQTCKTHDHPSMLLFRPLRRTVA